MYRHPFPKFPENPSTEELIKFWKLMDKFRDWDYVPAACQRGDCSEGMHSTKYHLVFPGYCHMSMMTLYFTSGCGHSSYKLPTGRAIKDL